MNKHKVCRRVYSKVFAALKSRYKKGTPIKMDVQFCSSTGAYSVRNFYGLICTIETCCKWRARVHAVKVLQDRG